MRDRFQRTKGLNLGLTYWIDVHKKGLAIVSCAPVQKVCDDRAHDRLAEGVIHVNQQVALREPELGGIAFDNLRSHSNLLNILSGNRCQLGREFYPDDIFK